MIHNNKFSRRITLKSHPRITLNRLATWLFFHCERNSKVPHHKPKSSKTSSTRRFIISKPTFFSELMKWNRKLIECSSTSLFTFPSVWRSCSDAQTRIKEWTKCTRWRSANSIFQERPDFLSIPFMLSHRHQPKKIKWEITCNNFVKRRAVECAKKSFKRKMESQASGSCVSPSANLWRNRWALTKLRQLLRTKVFQIHF